MENTSDIILWNVIYEVNGKFYTTRPDYDHSWLCDVDMADLVLIEDADLT